MRRARRNRFAKNKVISDINLTNLIDVTMTTLVCYMIIAPIVDQGIDVNLPQSAPSKIQSKDEPIIITVTKNDTLYMGSKIVTLSQLVDQLKPKIKLNNDAGVVIKADKDVNYGKVITVLDELNSAGITKVGMATETKD